MALMRDPTEVDPEVFTEQDIVFALEEDGDVAQENSEYTSVANFVDLLTPPSFKPEGV